MQKSKTRPISDKIINRQETQQQIIHDSMTKRLVPIIYLLTNQETNSENYGKICKIEFNYYYLFKNMFYSNLQIKMFVYINFLVSLNVCK